MNEKKRGGAGKLSRPEPAKTMADIARLSGVSKPTVSRALSNSPLVTEETRERVRRIAAAHGYAVNRNAQRLRHQRTNTIATIIDFSSLPGRRISQPFHFELLAEVTNALSVRNLDLLLRTNQDEDPAAYQAMLSAQDVDGILFLGEGAREPMFRALAKTSVPFVVWGAVDPRSTYCTVGSDNLQGGRLAGRRFRELARQRIVFLGSLGHRELAQRHEGLKAGLGPDGEVIAVEPADLSSDAAYRALKTWLARAEAPPQGVFAISDTFAMAAISALREADLDVPGDVSVIGYDDVAQAEHFFPPLTTVRQDARLAGALLVEKLMQRIDGVAAQSATLPTEIVIRST